MTKPPKPPKNPGEEPRPNGDGYYWLYDHRRDTVYLMLYGGGIWHDVLYEGMAGKEVIEGPLPFPTPEQITSRHAHFEAVRASEWARVGVDPLWDLGEPEVPSDPNQPLYRPDPMMDGWFWIQFLDQEFPEVVLAHEGTLSAMELDGPSWEHSNPDLVPTILFGPLVPPAKETVKSRVPESAALARSHLPRELQ